MKYQDLVQYVANEFVSTITEDCPSCERFSEYTNIMGMTPSEVKEEFIFFSVFGIKELSDGVSMNELLLDPFTGNIGSIEFDEDIPYKTFKKDVTKLINSMLS